MKLLKQVTIQSTSHRADDTVKLTLHSSIEQTNDQYKHEWHDLRKMTGTLYFKSDDGLSTEEINQIDKVKLDKPDGKSQSERLRNSLYVLCKQKKGSAPTKDEFARWYHNKMEKFIQHVQGQLEND